MWLKIVLTKEAVKAKDSQMHNQHYRQQIFMSRLGFFSRPVFIILLMLVIVFESYSQKQIIKNGIKINRIDTKDRKQGSWFFFDPGGNIILSCTYKDDSLISPLTFYNSNDTVFTRFPKLGGMEVFIIQINGKKLVGNYQAFSKDSSVVDFVGIYKEISGDSFYIDSNTEIENSKQKTDSVLYWIHKVIAPVYMFGNVQLTDYFYARFRSSDFTFNKTIYSNIYIDESGIVTKVEFPRDKNTTSTDEETELSSIFLTMQRWQPAFSGNRTVRCSYPLVWKSTIRY